MDLDAVRTFVAAAEAGRFQDAAAELSVTQQAVSKRIAALENDLGVRLFTRTARGSLLTPDGRAFLSHARDLLRAEERAAASVRPGRRALCVDVIGRRLAPADLLRDFHRAHPDVGLDVVTLPDADTAVDAIRSGAVDVSFRAVAAAALPDGVRAERVRHEPVQLLTGPAHELADAGAIPIAALEGHPIWMPGIGAPTEWGAFYRDLAAAFGLTVDATGPDFGTEPLLDVLAASSTVASFIGEQSRLLWPADYDLRRVTLHDPVPVYPHSLVWREDNPHPALTALRAHLGTAPPATGTWTPKWTEDPRLRPAGPRSR
ncbi:LysR family transcriptional regulator [Umezawaea sp. Da 62-37]|uniref:LysR family transcriptional regulator n=1 Tax=Umezawaea sp. Da 62-37 TaxID=3075927 RepID=UPI0028F6D4A0|nr:LysR family transcriptional regulator [Umezawaea sp. Da 62-37]WNV84452.1 LysR family transcriptional regulator [Umezawaea sp. Da 62-37]